jgi:hypothetical protein
MMKYTKAAGSLRWVILPAVVLMLIFSSCLKDAPESLPERIEWDPALAIPLGDDRFDLFDVTEFDSSELELDTITGLPEWIDRVYVVMEGTLDFGLSSIQDNLDQINGVLFRVSFENGFPDEIFAQAYFQDESGEAIDSMFLEGPMAVPPGRVAENGKLLAPGKAIQDAYFDRERILPLQNATLVALKAFFIVTEPDSALIPHYPDFQFNVHIGAMFDLTLEF